MKTIIKCILAAPLMLCFSSCLDEHPKDQLDQEAIYNNADNIYKNAVASLYNYIGSNQESEGLQGTCRGIYDYNTLTTDEAMIPIRGGDWYDGGLWENMYQHNWNANDINLYNVWKYLFKVIVISNQSLSIIDSHKSLLSAEQTRDFTAEVRAVRALFYYYAMDMFGRVPIVTSYDVKLEQVTQSERSEVFKFIVDELQDVAPQLADEHSNKEGNYYGRVTRPVANFLLAKLALNAEIYTDDNWTDGKRQDGKSIYFNVNGEKKNAWETCIWYCEQLRQEGYELESDYASNFAVHNENSKENIFTIPLDKNLYLNEYHYLYRSRHYKHGGAYGGSSENGTCATVSTVKSFGYGTDHVDNRFKINFYADTVLVDGKKIYLDNGKPLVYMPLELKLNLSDSPYKQTAGARVGKYEVDRTAYSDGRQVDNDIVLFRYGDALLMEAEAKVRNGEDGSIELNAIRDRVGMPHVEANLDNILKERLLELVWEGWRRQDLIRFGKYTKAYDQRTPLEKESTGFTTVFPIPQRCLDLNKKLKQNPSY
ncbi:RagB/SusD family nutrient uptake outer membrane protein [Segatella copri]|uniref:RagB/SusD family nutrient uptake outer membrane protein n=1 Tax=Segatella copri TaxID=165179 RepID=UPI00294AC916|nr:RagB/SusD family nutrient uptake outer membrane protein [Segatella copri]WOF96151.1 RagB/SusD family nutrient uptake outer membrane protein [Segatella copri]